MKIKICKQPKCNSKENRAGAKFCGRCGNKFPTRIERLFEELDLIEERYTRFCERIGEKMESSYDGGNWIPYAAFFGATIVLPLVIQSCIMMCNLPRQDYHLVESRVQRGDYSYWDLREHDLENPPQIDAVGEYVRKYGCFP